MGSSPVMSFVAGRSDLVTGAGLRLARLGGLAAVMWGVSQQDLPGVAGEHLAVTALMVASGVGWIGWLATRRLVDLPPVTFAALALLAGAGGALAALAPVAMTFPAVAALGAGIGLQVRPAIAVTGIGAVSALVAGAASGAPAGFMVSGALASVAGLMAGRSRRQYTERARQAEALLGERLRADTERDRAAALAERNRIAREIHDVLAHSLGALAVQLDAADAVLEDGADPEKARQLVRAARGLAVQGLTETRQAVHALRDEPVALVEQLGALVAHDGATLSVSGTAHPLDAGAGVALYRAAQEAITNARKHAPGAQVSIHLDFGAGATVVTVTNGAPAESPDTAPLAHTGGGYGLTGMRERIELLGGSFSAAPDGPGFTVRVAVPA